MEHRLKINAKTIDNRPTIDQKSNKNEPKISLGGVSGVTWGLLAARIEKTQMEYQLVGPLEIPTEYYIQKSKEKKDHYDLSDDFGNTVLLTKDHLKAVSEALQQLDDN